MLQQEGDQKSAVPAEAAEEQEEFDREAVARGRRSAHQERPRRCGDRAGT